MDDLKRWALKNGSQSDFAIIKMGGIDLSIKPQLLSLDKLEQLCTFRHQSMAVKRKNIAGANSSKLYS